MDFLAVHWIWMYVGAGLMVCELVTPGFVVFFFGVGAAATGVLLAIFPGLPPWGQLLTFCVFSAASLLTLRKWFMGKLGVATSREEVQDIEDGFKGKLARTVAEIKPGLPGRVLLGDAEWDAVADAPIPQGAEVRVVSRNNLTLKVESLTV